MAVSFSVASFLLVKAVQLDHTQMALGNNTLAVTSFRQKEDKSEAGRVTYYFKDGDRIDKDDFELGVVPAKDPGAFDQADIYKIENDTHFCQAIQPSNQTEFGVFGHIGNNFGYKIGESFTPTSQWQDCQVASLSVKPVTSGKLNYQKLQSPSLLVQGFRDQAMPSELLLKGRS